MAAPTVRTANTNAGGTSASPTVPTDNAVAGDLAFGFLKHNDLSSTLTPHADWTPLASVDEDNRRLWFGYRIIQAGDPTSWTFTLTASEQYASGSLIITVGTFAAVWDEARAILQGQPSTPDSSTIRCPTVTAAGDERLLVCAGGVSGTISAIGSFTPPAGMDERIDTWTQAARGFTVATAVVNTGATGTKDFALVGATATDPMAISQLIAPAAAPPAGFVPPLLNRRRKDLLYTRI